jgi:transglutaminase-like putative cysteine protease
MSIYAVRHVTRYRYSAPIHENVMEARMLPRTEGGQRCFQFNLSVTPQAQVDVYQDYLGNAIHHFDIPRRHVQLSLTAESIVDVQPPDPLPEALDDSAWTGVSALANDGTFWDLLQPSHFARPTPLLHDLTRELTLNRAADPLTTLRRLNEALYNGFDYAPQSTRVDSPIDEAIAARRGVCQDFTHIMLALARELGLPARYVSGYLYHERESDDRSAEDASHAWVEVYLPEFGWIGFDPTNNLVTSDRHIRVAVGCDYADVPARHLQRPGPGRVERQCQRQPGRHLARVG